MKIVTLSSPNPPVSVDRTQPIVVFDTWPFRKLCVSLANEPHYWWDGAKLHLRDYGSKSKDDLGSALYQGDFLATATDGRTVFGKSINMENLP